MKIIRRSTVALLLMIFIFGITTFADSEFKNITLPDGSNIEIKRIETINGYIYEVRFSDGETFTWQHSGSYSHGSSGLDMPIEQVQLAQEAIKMYEEIYGLPKVSSDSKSNPIGFVLILVGLFHVISPRSAWFLEIGWKLKDAEPSDLALALNRIGGVIACIIGLIMVI